VKVADQPVFGFDNTFVRDLVGLFEPWQAAQVPHPRLLVLNDALAAELGLDPAALRSPAGVAVLAGNELPDGAAGVAQAYAGHQFGGYSPRLGDGRALLLGEVLDASGRRRDLHMKGSGRTPFARGGDGKAAVGPMLREYVIGEAMHALGIPTTRALSVVATGEHIARDTMLPGAVLTRVAASHLRVGTFQYAAAHSDIALLRRLTDYAIDRHFPAAAHAERPALALLDGVIEAQAALIARWMLVGFVHGVMNTDNMTISGETIDYGPCAFVDTYHPATVFSSIDHQGRYALGNQPRIGLWNLARLAEALLPLVDADDAAAVAAVTERLHTYGDRYDHHWEAGMRAKLGLTTPADGDRALFDDLLTAMTAGRCDYTGTMRSLSAVARGGAAPDALRGWVPRWSDRLAAEGRDAATVAAGMDHVNPAYVPRNHLVEAALAAATTGDLGPFERLVEAVSHPYDERPGLEDHALPAPADFGHYVTFCGT
jgi:uncharacterized protein YdiU (UPF0061 family)